MRTSKKLLSLFLAVMLTFGVFAYMPFTASAALYDGGWLPEANYQNVNYRIDETTTGFDGLQMLNIQPGDVSYAWSESDLNDLGFAAQNLQYEVYAGYDANNVYLKVITDAANYYNDKTAADAGDMWSQSVLQVALADWDDTGADRLEFGIGRNSSTGEQLFTVWSQNPYAQSELTAPNFSVDLINGDTQLQYEVAIPVNTFLNRDTIQTGDEIGLCLVMGQSIAGDGGYIHTQIASGITGDPGKAAENFANIYIGANAPSHGAYHSETNIGNVNYEIYPYTPDVIDGTLKSGYTQLPVDKYKDLSGTDKSALNLDFEVYASFDENYVYLYVSMDSSQYYNDVANFGDMWSQSCLQVGLAQVGDTEYTRLEYGIARDSATSGLKFVCWSGYPGAEEFIPVDGTDYNIVLDSVNGRINYEVRTPAATFLTNGATDQFKLCLVMSQYDVVNDMFIHTQIASGITGDPGKAAENFATITTVGGSLQGIDNGGGSSDGGWVPEANVGNINYTIGYYTPNVINGMVKSGYTKLPVAAGDISGVGTGALGLAFEAYASFDENYVYLLVSMDDSKYYNNVADAGDMWMQSCIQVGLAQVGDTGFDRLEYGIARNSETGQLMFNTWGYPGGDELNLTAGTDYNIVIDNANGRIIYEVRTPISTFLTYDKTLASGGQFKLCLVMAQYDSVNGGYIHTQIASGITGDPGKAAENFATITVTGGASKTIADNLLSNITGSADDILTGVNNIANDPNVDLPALMQNSPDVLDAIKNLEDKYTSDKNITVGTDTQNTGAITGNVMVVGAGLNAVNVASATDIQIVFKDTGAPAKFDTAAYANEIPVDIKLEINGVPKDDTLVVPVTITMPVPDGLINNSMTVEEMRAALKKIVILHYNADGTNYETIYPVFIFDVVNGTYLMKFTVTHFSTFVFAMLAEKTVNPPPPVYPVYPTNNNNTATAPAENTDAGKVTAAVVYGSSSKTDKTKDTYKNPYIDVKDGDWFADAVRIVTELGIMKDSGTADTFKPDELVNRYMMATLLYRIAGEPEITGDIAFTDVKADEWYTNAVIWASGNGLMKGFGDGIFGGEETLTREQIATVLYRYAGMLGLDVSTRADMAQYSDSDKISDWAEEAMSWTLAAGLFDGRVKTEIVPNGEVARAEIAFILAQFISIKTDD